MRRQANFYYRLNSKRGTLKLYNSSKKNLYPDSNFLRFSDLEYFLEGYCGGRPYSLRPIK